MNTVALSFVFFLLAFVAIGMLSVLRKKRDVDDYMLASRSVSPALTALSAVATNNSGFMFIGLIGMTYTMGISAAWLMIGWIFGDFLAWFFVHKRLRYVTEKENVRTFSELLGVHRNGTDQLIVKVAGLAIVLFLGTYAAAQLNAGSKALHVLFGWPYDLGAIIGAVMVVLYCFAGGIRASIWTDAAQSVVMFFAMLILLYVAQAQAGGVQAMWQSLHAIDPQLTSWHPQGLELGLGMFVLGWVIAGLGVVGQPHIMVRFMAIESVDGLKVARRYYFAWYITFSVMAVLVGLAARLLLPEVQNFDAELALPSLSMNLLPDVLVGLVLAGLFAATMSTADSQIISCSSTITQDLLPEHKRPYLAAKIATLAVAAVVLFIALIGSKSVFYLVVLAWAALASVLGPLVILRLLGYHPRRVIALTMMGAGFAGVLIWRYALGLSGSVYEVLPGMLAGLVVFFIAKFSGGLHAEERTRS